jgi:hypothetical protein
VVVEGADAARSGDPTHNKHLLEEGSATVFIGARPATRAGDRSTCRGVVIERAKRTLIGGPKTGGKKVDAEHAKHAEDDAPSLTTALGAELANQGASRILNLLAQALMQPRDPRNEGDAR